MLYSLVGVGQSWIGSGCECMWVWWGQGLEGTKAGGSRCVGPTHSMVKRTQEDLGFDLRGNGFGARDI